MLIISQQLIVQISLQVIVDLKGSSLSLQLVPRGRLEIDRGNTIRKNAKMFSSFQFLTKNEHLEFASKRCEEIFQNVKQENEHIESVFDCSMTQWLMQNRPLFFLEKT